MNRNIIIVILILLAIFAIGSVSASEDISCNDSAISDELLAQDSSDDFQKTAAAEEEDVVQSAESSDGEILQVSENQDKLGMEVINDSADQSVLGASKKASNVPSYLAKTNIWYQDFSLLAEDSNMWILNDNAKAFPKGSFIKIVAKEKGSSYKAQDTVPIEDIFAERGMENIHYYILLREFTKIQFKPDKSYQLRIYFISPEGKTYQIGKKTVKITFGKNLKPRNDHNVYCFYKYWKNNPLGDIDFKVFKTHPNDKEKIMLIFYKKNGEVLANKKVKCSVNGVEFQAKTNSRGLLVLDTPKKPGKYLFTVQVLKGWFDFNVKVSHSVSIPDVAIKKSAKKVVIPLQLRKIDGKFYKNQKITFKFNNKTYIVKTDSKGVAKVTIKQSVLKKLAVGQKVTLEATYKKDTISKILKVKK